MTMNGDVDRVPASIINVADHGHLQALVHGLNRHYYSITINYRKNEHEQKMLLKLHKKTWSAGLTLEDYAAHTKTNEKTMKELLELAKAYNKVCVCVCVPVWAACCSCDVHAQSIQDEDAMTKEQLAIKNVGKKVRPGFALPVSAAHFGAPMQDPKRHLEEKVGTLMKANLVQLLSSMVDTIVF
jgi:26S proteasome regulatory subunit N11